MRSLRPGRNGAARRRVGVAAACVWLCLLSGRAEGASAYEGFDYPVGTPHANFAGGTGLRRSGNADSTVAPGSLSDPTGTLLTSGGHIESARGFGAGMLSYSVERRDLVGSGDFWLSFLMRQSAISPNSPTGMYMTSGGQGTYFIGQRSGPGITGLIITGGDFMTAALSGVPFEPDRDYFLVAHFQRGEGNDLATLYVDPTPGAQPPTGGTTFAGEDFFGRLPSFFFFASAVVPMVASVDELRVGTTYAEVAPVVPEPGAGVACLTAVWTLALRRRRSPARSGRTQPQNGVAPPPSA